MRIHEYQAKEIFARYGLRVPNSAVASSPEEARKATQELGGQAVLKAQVHAGGRGLAGGVKVVRSPNAAEETARAMLGTPLVTAQTGPEGSPVNQLLVEEMLDEIGRELYLAITVDSVQRCPVVLVSGKGGMDIEQVAESTPEEIHTEPVDPVMGFMPFQSKRLAARLGLDAKQARELSQTIDKLCRIFRDNDCTLVEINPLVTSTGGKLIALDAKINLEDDSLFRQPALAELRDRSQEDALEAQAVDLGISYVNLEGDVGCLVNGAGLAMATLDAATNAGASPANFLDVGGGSQRREGRQRGGNHPVRRQGQPGTGQRVRRHPPLRHRRRGNCAGVPEQGQQLAPGGAHVGHQRRRRQSDSERFRPARDLCRHLGRGSPGCSLRISDAGRTVLQSL